MAETVEAGEQHLLEFRLKDLGAAWKPVLDRSGANLGEGLPVIVVIA